MELGQLVEEEHAMVGEGDLARAWHRSTADETGIGDRVVRRPEGATCDQRLP